jgi:hypothetical protein
MGRSDIHIEVWLGNLKEGDYLQDSRKREEILEGFLYISIGLDQARGR